MLKYLYHKVVFQEVPDETSLAIAISGCRIRCKNCHSKELWEDKGTDLTIEELDRLIAEQHGITCVLLMGGEHNLGALTVLLMHLWGKVKAAWYCGLDRVPLNYYYVYQYLHYIKLGHYDEKLGGLKSPITNQRLYRIHHHPDGDYRLSDLTFRFHRQPEHQTLSEGLINPKTVLL